ncbi:PKD domain-containing protein [Halovivax limisalsi]|uniref:PKD domain-containing protein n=1 Tax=Halovivax limisalsi TaxID=1453760 RepID=UPI001FFD68F3|nr:PKD domain-containing protein [Halovivax limisalsi]
MTDAFNVYVYANTSGLDVETPANGLQETLDMIVADSTIPAFDVQIMDENPNIQAGSIYDMIQPWRQWLQQNDAFQGPGSHLLGAEGYGGIAEGSGHAWIEPMVCVSMLEGFVFSQEVLHNFINSSLPEVREMGYAQDYEHSLGKVFEGAEISPMTAGYVEDGHAAAGQCGREEPNATEVLTPTECTTLANQYSWENDDGEGGNQPPSAGFDISPTDPAVDETITFDASASSDPDGSITSYEWDFGDGSTGSGETDTHSYSAAGEYTAELTVTDDAGATDSTTQTVMVEEGEDCGADSATGSADGHLAWWNEEQVHTYATQTASPCGVTVELDGPGFADFDLYVTYDGRTPTREDYDDRSAGSGATESVSGSLSGTTDVGIMVYAAEGWGEYSVSITEDGTQ